MKWIDFPPKMAMMQISPSLPPCDGRPRMKSLMLHVHGCLSACLREELLLHPFPLNFYTHPPYLRYIRLGSTNICTKKLSST